MKRYKKYITFFIFMLFLAFNKNVNAAIVNVSADKTSINVGDEFNVNVNLNGAAVSTLTIKLSVDTSKVEYLSGPTNSNLSGERIIYTWTDLTGGSSPITGGTFATFKFKAKSPGSVNFSLSGEFYDSDENSIDVSIFGANVTITEKKEENIVVEEKPKDIQTPSVVPNNNNVGTNTIQKNLSTNANLKSLQLGVEGLSPIFNKDTLQYWLVVDENISDINIVATPEDYNAQVSVSGNNNLKIGSNNIEIRVIAQNGTKKTYTINVTKTENLDNANANLEILAVENFNLLPEFSADITNYLIEVENNIDTLNIIAIPQVEGSKVTINQPEILSYGENIVEIVVLAKDGITKKIYTIEVNKKNEESAPYIEENRWFKKLYFVIIFIIVVAFAFFTIMYIKKKKMQ